MHRFFLEPELIQTPSVLFPLETSRQIVNVLRLKTGANVIVLDNSGTEYNVQLTHVGSDACFGTVTTSRPCPNEPKTNLTLLLCLTQREKFEWILQKGTEVGVRSFLPVLSTRTLIQSESDAVEKFPRWKKILREAAEQSGRGIVPSLLMPHWLTDAVLEHNDAATLRLVFWEGENQTTLKHALRLNRAKSITILVGPEGGLSQGEVDYATSAGFIPVTLGTRILRMETAAIVASALVLYEME